MRQKGIGAGLLAMVLLLLLCGCDTGANLAFAGDKAAHAQTVDNTAPAPPEYKGKIALTFDDGPHPTNTPRLLELLEREDAVATFFVLGERVRYYPEILKDTASRGHSIGNHTTYHSKLTKLKENEYAWEIDDGKVAISSALGYPAGSFRPPYGAYHEGILEYLDVPMVMWSVDSEDWKSRDKDTIIDKVLSEVQPGDIILMHDIYDSSIDAVQVIIPALKEQGYEFVTVQELLGEMEEKKVYFKK